MLNLKERWERVKAAEMDSKRRKTLHKNSGINGRRKILRFDTFIFASIIFYGYERSHNDFNFNKSWATCPLTTYKCSTMHNLIVY
jgi:hypothetical protein